MKTITLTRPEETFNQYVSYDVLVDGEIVQSIGNGDELTFEVDDDAKNLKSKLLWCGSNVLSLKDLNNHSKISIQGNAFFNSKLPLAGLLLPMAGAFLFQSFTMKMIMTSIIALILVALILSLTIGKDRWLKMESI